MKSKENFQLDTFRVSRVELGWIFEFMQNKWSSILLVNTCLKRIVGVFTENQDESNLRSKYLADKSITHSVDQEQLNKGPLIVFGAPSFVWCEENAVKYSKTNYPISYFL